MASTCLLPHLATTATDLQTITYFHQRLVVCQRAPWRQTKVRSATRSYTRPSKSSYRLILPSNSIPRPATFPPLQKYVKLSTSLHLTTLIMQMHILPHSKEMLFRTSRARKRRHKEKTILGMPVRWFLILLAVMVVSVAGGVFE